MDWSEKVRAFEIEGLELPKITEDYLLSVEKAARAALPDDYKDFLRFVGEAASWMGPTFVAEDGEESFIEISYGVDPEGGYDLLANLDSYQGRVPVTMLPVGRDAFSNLICVGLIGDDRGKVFFWNHENENIDGPPWRENVHKIADSFTEFMEKLKAEE
jgi:hypothetical protein